MNELQLANGLSATLTFNIPTALQAEAPATIDWWSFDETLGYWKHEGEAQKQGTQYIGLASHFSWWNCDVPENFNDFHGAVNSAGGFPVSDAQINVISPTLGTGITYTNAEGTFTCRVPKNQSLTLNVNLTCSATNDWALAHTETITSSTQPLTSSISASLDGRYPIIGTVVNCTGQPILSAYVKIGQQIFNTNNGDFSIQTCSTGNYSIRGFDTTNPDSIKSSELVNVLVQIDGFNAGNIETCFQNYGIVLDIDGNAYPTVLIGSQWWMAENLKTAHFADGSVVPNIINNAEWASLITPSWCNQGNNEENDDSYGKLYNWYTIADPRNVCPMNWHVPTQVEWSILTEYLGGVSLAGNKMKTTFGWQTNSITFNQSGFSALPGGVRYYFDGVFTNLGNNGLWWSSTESPTTDAWSLSIVSSGSAAYGYLNNKRMGISVRCLKD